MYGVTTNSSQPLPPSVIGFRVGTGDGEHVVGLSALGRLVLEPLRRPTSARAHFVAAGALAAQGVRLAVTDLLRPPPPTPVVAPNRETRPAELRALSRAERLVPPARAQRHRWTAAETAALGELLAVKRERALTYRVMAAELSGRFGRPFTERQVGDKARRMRLASPAAASPRRKARGAA